MAAPLPNNNTAPLTAPIPTAAPIPNRPPIRAAPMPGAPLPTALMAPAAPWPPGHAAPLPMGAAPFILPILPVAPIPPGVVPAPIPLPMPPAPPIASRTRPLSDSANTERSEQVQLLHKNKGATANRNDDLIYGYVRCNYHDADRIFPVEMIKLIIFFYDAGFVWSFTREEIELFPSIDMLVSTPVTVHDTVFHYQIQLDYTQKVVFFCLEMESMPKHMDNMMIYFQMQLVETNHYYKESGIFGTYMPCNNYKYAVTGFRDLMLFESMTFRGTMDILHVHHRSNHRLNVDPRFMNLTKMRANCTSAWDVKTVHLQSIRAPRMGIMTTKPFLYGPSFNQGVFSLFMERVPNYEVEYYGGSRFRVGIKIYRLPNCVKRLLVSMVITCLYGSGKDMVCVKKHSRRSKISCGWRHHVIMPSLRRLNYPCTSIQFKVTIKIQKAFNYQDEEISDGLWKEHGIL
eukprot:919440_1